MSMRISILGRYQGLDSDETTTGAICIAGQARGRVHGRNWLLQGDKTTPCPGCGQPGTLVEGEPYWSQDGIPTVLDGALVACGCPIGSNRVIAGGSAALATSRASAPEPVNDAVRNPDARARTIDPERFRDAAPSVAQPVNEPGFYIVPRSMSYDEVLIELGAPYAHLSRSALERLNPTSRNGFKPGELFVVGEESGYPMCTRQEMSVMGAAEQARAALADLTEEEAGFMMQYQAEIAALFGDTSLAMGVAETVAGKSLDEITRLLRKIEDLHKAQFTKHGHLRHPDFFAQRQHLFNQLSAGLKATFLNKRLNLGDYSRLRRDLGISSKSLVHHWSKAGGPTSIPGYSTHLDRLAKMAKYLKAGGAVGITLGGIGSAMNIADACRVGNTKACRKMRFTEAGNFSGGLVGGWGGAKLVSRLTPGICWWTGPKAWACGIVVTGAGALAGSLEGMEFGEYVGEVIFEALQND